MIVPTLHPPIGANSWPSGPTASGTGGVDRTDQATPQKCVILTPGPHHQRDSKTRREGCYRPWFTDHIRFGALRPALTGRRRPFVASAAKVTGALDLPMTPTWPQLSWAAAVPWLAKAFS